MPGASSNVFISYASPDKAVADSVCTALERAGLNCWIAPRDVVPGEFYADAIVHAIDSARLIVLILSRDAAASPHVLREVERASSKKHPVISLRTDLDPLPAAFEYFLNTSQWLDASASGVEAVLPKLIEAVRRGVAQPTGAAPVAASPPAQSSAPSGAPSPPSGSKRLAVVLGAVVVVGAAYIAIDKLVAGKHPTATEAPAGSTGPATATPAAPAEAAIPEKSVAVLPFTDMSEKKDQEYFSDGMTEEIIDVLAKVPELRVPARTSSFYFKGKSEDIQTIAARLRVANVLEGSVRTSGRNVRIAVQLVRADSGYHLWSETYERRLDDVFKVQDEIAAAVANALQVSLLANPSTKKDRTLNPQAHALFLQGVHYETQATKQDRLRAIASFEAAIRLDPSQGFYWAQLSRTCADLASIIPGERSAWRDRALQAAEKALTLDPRLPQSHIARAKVAYLLDLDYATGAAEIAAAGALDPGDVSVLEWQGLVVASQGRPEEALQLQLRSLELDPLAAIQHENTATAYFDLGRYADVERVMRKALELNPAAEGAYAQIGLAMLLAGGNAAAAQAEIAREPDADQRNWSQAMAGQLTGHGELAARWLAAHENAAASADDVYSAAQLHAMRGETDLAFAALDRAYEARSGGLVDARNDPFLKSLREDPRFAALLRRLKLPV